MTPIGQPADAYGQAWQYKKGKQNPVLIPKTPRLADKKKKICDINLFNRNFILASFFCIKAI
jgi:hypothetical protein